MFYSVFTFVLCDCQHWRAPSLPGRLPLWMINIVVVV